MKKIILAAAALAALPLAACTSTEVGQAAAGVNAACAVAGVGTEIAVIVTSSIGGRTATTGGQVTDAVDRSCAAITASTAKIVQQITDAGGTATVRVAMKSPRLGRVRRSMRVRPGV